MTRRQYLDAFDRANLCPEKWSTRVARERAAELERPSPLVLLGAKVCDAFEVPFRPFTFKRTPMSVPASVLVVLPHPSGLSRAWNEPGAYERARATLREAGVLG